MWNRNDYYFLTYTRDVHNVRRLSESVVSQQCEKDRVGLKRCTPSSSVYGLWWRFYLRLCFTGELFLGGVLLFACSDRLFAYKRFFLFAPTPRMVADA
jgi:hypothetical protein